MNKKKVLATLVMLSLMQGTAYADYLKPALTQGDEFAGLVWWYDGALYAKDEEGKVEKLDVVTDETGHKVTTANIKGDVSGIALDYSFGSQSSLKHPTDELVLVFDGNVDVGYTDQDKWQGIQGNGFMVGSDTFDMTIKLQDDKTLYVGTPKDGANAAIELVDYVNEGKNGSVNLNIKGGHIVTHYEGDYNDEDNLAVFGAWTNENGPIEPGKIIINNESINSTLDDNFNIDYIVSGTEIENTVLDITTKNFILGTENKRFDRGVWSWDGASTRYNVSNNLNWYVEDYGAVVLEASNIEFSGTGNALLDIANSSDGAGILLTGGSKANTGENGINSLTINGGKYGLIAQSGSNFDMKGNVLSTTVSAEDGSNIFLNKSSATYNFNTVNLNNAKYGLLAQTNSTLTINSNDLDVITNGTVSATGAYISDNSNLNITAEENTISATFAVYANDNSTYSSKTNISDYIGQVKIKNGSKADFLGLNKDDYGIVKIEYTRNHTISAESDSKDNLSEINFKQAAIIKAQEDAVYNPDLKYSAVKANSNSKITFDKAYKIYGDIIASGGSDTDKGGKVIVNSLDNANADFKGDVLAGNSGEIEFTLNSANFEGRVDDYQDAGLKEATFNPDEFDESVKSQGTVNVTLNNSTWDVTGQSWVTKLEGDNSTIILNGDETKGYAVHIGTLSGNNTFVLNLTPEALETSDMIYVQNGTDDKQTLLVANERELVDNKDWDEIRFATVADADGSVGDSNFDYGGSFGDTYTIKGRGVRNVDYEIKYVAMDEDTITDEDNKKYNGGESFDEVKPGEDYVQDNYNKIDENKNSQYIYLVRNENDTPVVNPDEELTDSGKTVINMSRANYKNAIYMDRLNKRLGEARYINNEEEQGMWVRLRHDRIGQSGDFRSMNTMYELGYDEKQDCDNGERRVGFAVDYMRGSTTYSDILGKGETKRYGLWLYDTWMGDKGHYADYVAKWGHLSNDFDIRDKDSFERVTGDYSNNVFSVSAEYGRKKDIGNDWYFEPQAQLQLARVTGAEYTTTTQDTKVSVDGINSLIGRAGFRLGRDVDERSTVYIKADLLHEFLGDQTITATDATGSLRETFENKGTWYDVGFGFATALGKDSYAFMDFEKSFGNDNDETYQINAGVQWTF